MVYKPKTQIPETDSGERLKIWADHFRSLSIAGPKGTVHEETTEANSGISSITDDQISWTEVSLVLKSMRKGKAAGNDMIPGEIYKLVENETEPSSNLAKSMILLLNNIYNGEVIPKVDKYVYLGIEFNDTLNIELISKYRQYKGKETFYGLMATLRNTRVPLEYRNMLIKSILIPTIHYGAEVFGMNEQRVNAFKRILDNGIKGIVKRSNFCRTRAYEELDIKSIYISAAVSRARGLKKWTNSNGLISDCIKSQIDFKSKESAWIKEANENRH